MSDSHSACLGLAIQFANIDGSSLSRVHCSLYVSSALNSSVLILAINALWQSLDWKDKGTSNPFLADFGLPYLMPKVPMLTSKYPFCSTFALYSAGDLSH